MPEYPSRPCKLNGELFEPVIIKLTATISSNNPNVKNSKTQGDNSLNRITEIQPIPYASKEKVIIKAPIIDKLLILVNPNIKTKNFIKLLLLEV